MAQLINEAKRFQKLANIKESQLDELMQMLDDEGNPLQDKEDNPGIPSTELGTPNPQFNKWLNQISETWPIVGEDVAALGVDINTVTPEGFVAAVREKGIDDRNYTSIKFGKTLNVDRNSGFISAGSGLQTYGHFTGISGRITPKNYDFGTNIYPPGSRMDEVKEGEIITFEKSGTFHMGEIDGKDYQIKPVNHIVGDRIKVLNYDDSSDFLIGTVDSINDDGSYDIKITADKNLEEIVNEALAQLRKTDKKMSSDVAALVKLIQANSSLVNRMKTVTNGQEVNDFLTFILNAIPEKITGINKQNLIKIINDRF